MVFVPFWPEPNAKGRPLKWTLKSTKFPKYTQNFVKQIAQSWTRDTKTNQSMDLKHFKLLH